jgi:hypothetical protein
MGLACLHGGETLGGAWQQAAFAAATARRWVASQTDGGTPTPGMLHGNTASSSTSAAVRAETAMPARLALLPKVLQQLWMLTQFSRVGVAARQPSWACFLFFG